MIKLHCSSCSHDYDTILAEDEFDAAVCPRCGSFGSSVPFDQAMTETPEEPLTPPPPAAPVANPREVEIQPETSRKTREGSSRTPPSETRSDRNSRGRFSGRLPRKGLFIAGGVLVLLIIAAGVTWFTKQAPGSSNTVDVVIETETPQAPEKKAEEEQAEQQAPAPTPEKPAPPAPKVVKKTPKASSPTPKASAPGNAPWRYRVETPAPKPAPQPRAQTGRNPLGKLFEVFGGPAPDVTPAPAPNDPRGSGM